MAYNHVSSEYTRTYTSFSGCDLVCTFGSVVIGELQAISYSISREKAPVYTLGSAEPRSFSRGKRGIAGSLVFTSFDRDALLYGLKENVARKAGTMGKEENKEMEFWTQEEFQAFLECVADKPISYYAFEILY